MVSEPKKTNPSRKCQACGKTTVSESLMFYCPVCGFEYGKKPVQEVKIKDAHVSTITLTNVGNTVKFEYENEEIGLYTEISKEAFWKAIDRLER